MKINKYSSFLEVEHKGTTIQIPKQDQSHLYVRLVRDDIYVIIQVIFPEPTSKWTSWFWRIFRPKKFELIYNIQPEYGHLVTDDDLQNIGVIVLHLIGARNVADAVIKESDVESYIPQESDLPSET